MPEVTDSQAEGFVDPRRVQPSHVLGVSLYWRVWVFVFFLISGYALIDLSSYPAVWGKAGLAVACAQLCAWVLFTFCWAAVLAFVVRKCNWSPRACAWAAILPGLSSLVLWIGQGRITGLPSSLMWCGLVAGFICRKLAYPTITDRQFSRVDPRPRGVF
jgi:hypothetical protein